MSFFHEIRHERLYISLESYFNGVCPFCDQKVWKILDSWLHSVAEMGSPTREIMADVEMKRIQCQKCGQIFTPEHPQYPKSYQVSGDVIQYALGQAHKYQISAGQIASVLSEQHQVKVKPETVQNWINEFSEEYFQAYFQTYPSTAQKDFKAITIDGTHFNMGQDIIGKKKDVHLSSVIRLADGTYLLTWWE
jgi:hypothetical protein